MSGRGDRSAVLGCGVRGIGVGSLVDVCGRGGGCFCEKSSDFHLNWFAKSKNKVV